MSDNMVNLGPSHTKLRSLVSLTTRISEEKSRPANKEEVSEGTDESAVQSCTQETIGLSGNRQTKLRYWKAKDKAHRLLLCLHGFNDHSGAFETLASYLVEQGVDVYAFDQSGFGESTNAGTWPGYDVLVADFFEVLTLVKRQNPDLPVHIVGESMGGAVVITAEAENIERGKGRLPVKSIVLSAPAVWDRSGQPWLQHAVLDWFSNVAPQINLPLYNVGRKATDNEDVLSAMRSDPLIKDRVRINSLSGVVDLMDVAQSSAGHLRSPCLLLYGDNDLIIPRSSIDRFWNKLGSGHHRFMLYPEGWHLLTRDVQSLIVIKDISDWLEKGDVTQITTRNRIMIPRKANQSQKAAETIRMEI